MLSKEFITILMNKPWDEPYANITVWFLKHSNETIFDERDYANWCFFQDTVGEPVTHQEFIKARAYYLGPSSDCDTAIRAFHAIHKAYKTDHFNDLRQILHDMQVITRRLKSIASNNIGMRNESIYSLCEARASYVCRALEDVIDKLSDAECWGKYLEYLKSWIADHSNSELEKQSPMSFEEFCENDHSEEEF